MSNYRVTIVFRGLDNDHVEVRSISLEDIRDIALTPATPSEKSMKVLACSDLVVMSEKDLREKMGKSPPQVFAVGPQSDRERERHNWEKLEMHFYKAERFVASALGRVAGMEFLKARRPLECFLVDELPGNALAIYDKDQGVPSYYLDFNKDLGGFHITCQKLGLRVTLPVFQEEVTDDAAFEVLRLMAGDKVESSLKAAIKRVEDQDLKAEFLVRWGEEVLVVAEPEFVGRLAKGALGNSFVGYNPNAVVRVVSTPTEG